MFSAKHLFFAPPAHSAARVVQHGTWVTSGECVSGRENGICNSPQSSPTSPHQLQGKDCNCLSLPQGPSCSAPDFLLSFISHFPSAHTSLRPDCVICHHPTLPCSLICDVFTHFSSHFSIHRMPTCPSSLSSRVASSWKPSQMPNFHVHPGRGRGGLPLQPLGIWTHLQSTAAR